MEITTVALDLPFVKTKVNAYLVRHRHGLLIVDTGPHAPRTYLDLKRQIEILGYTLADVTHIVITHGHFDHFGLAARLKAVSGALVCYHLQDHSRIAEDILHRTDFSATSERRLRQMGFGAEFIQSGQQTQQTLIGERWVLRQNVAADVYLAEGDCLPTGNGLLEVVHCPGHTPGSICLWNSTEEVLFTGDHVTTQPMGEVLLEPHISAPPGEETDALQFMRSLEKIALLPARAFYPGHGLPGHHLRDRVMSIRAWLEEQCERIMNCLDRQPRTAVQINQMLAGPTHPSVETVSRVCQVTHCLQLLVARSALQIESGLYDAIYYRRS